jgi:hypothetical protein
MTLGKSMLVGAVCLIGAPLAANAQAQYPAYAQYQAYPYSRVPAAPQSWSYDPYTSGLSPCTQWTHSDLARCRDLMPPTYGQPDLRTR